VKFDVVTFGSGVVDVFASTGVAEKKGRLDLEVGSKYLIDGLRVEVGGGGTNCAVAFARFGLKTGCICKVGEDANGIEVLTALRSEKVKFLGKVGEGNTGYSMIVDSKKKNRTILTFKGASNDVSLIDIKRFKSQWLYYSSLLGKSFVAQKKLARQFVAGGGRLAFNPSSYSIEKQDIRGLLRLCYVLVLNKEEAVELAKKYKGKGKNVLEKLGSLGPKVVVVTDKDKAVRCYDGVKMYKVVPHKGKRVVERTGAGDAFAAGFVAGMVRGHPIKECLDLGVMESEAVLAHYGAKNNLLKIKLK